MIPVRTIRSKKREDDNKIPKRWHETRTTYTYVRDAHVSSTIGVICLMLAFFVLWNLRGEGTLVVYYCERCRQCLQNRVSGL